MRVVYLILIIVFAFFIVTFSQLNSEVVIIKYYYIERYQSAGVYAPLCGFARWRNYYLVF